MKKADVLVTFAATRTAYAAMRSLHRLGLKVAVADTKGYGMCQWSRFCEARFACAHPLHETARYVDDIVRITEDTGAHFVLPAVVDTPVLARHRDRLPDGAILPVAGHEKIRLANDKSRTAALAAGLGVPVPETLEWGDWDELEEKLRAMGSAPVVKLRWGDSSSNVFMPDGPDEALSLVRKLSARYSLAADTMPVVQRRVGGESWCVSCLYHEGRMLANFTQRSLRERFDWGGTSTLRVSAKNPLLESWAKKMLDSLGWHGLALVEFKFDPATGEGWFIEINPRLWSSIGLAAHSGVDFVGMLYTAATRGPEKALEMLRDRKEGVVCRWWLGDVVKGLSEAKRYRPAKALRLAMPGGTDHYDDIIPDDPGATAGAVATMAAKLFRRRGDNVKLREREMATQ